MYSAQEEITPPALATKSGTNIIPFLKSSSSIFSRIGILPASTISLALIPHLSAVSLPEYVIKVLPTPMFCLEDLTLATQSAIDSGYEGLMIRRKDSKYKCGRSTEKQGILGKIKLFKDSEARIVGIEELMVNNNPVTEDEFGLAKRSSHKVNLVGSGTLGSLELEDIYSGIRFSIGTGFTSAQREQLWVEKNNLLSKIIKYKYQGEGMVEKPRFPVFLGFRHEDDL